MNKIPFTEDDYNIHRNGTEEIFQIEKTVCEHLWSTSNEPEDCTVTPECLICGFQLHTIYY